jgi:tRNA (guanine37-N1)-methyltransferase
MAREALGIKVPKKQGEKIIALANRLGLSDRELAVQSDAESVYVPLVRQPTEKETNALREQVPEFQLEPHVFDERSRPEKTLAEALKNELPPDLLASLPKALDVIGDIAIVEIPPDLKPHEKLVGEAILQTHKTVKTVLAKAGAVSGTYRLREFSVIAGEARTTTVHKEYGCQYHVDVAKAYFSPRLSHEHKRVAALVREGEVVVDLFAGVGPFAVLIAKTQPNVKVYALDLNPDAVELLKKNSRVNRVQSRVLPVLGDARQVVHDKLSGKADRVIMNLPESAIEFVDVACETLKSEGGVVHFYGFVRAPDTVEALERRFAEAVEKTGRRVERFRVAKPVRETAPYQWQVVLDAKIV